MNGLSVLAVFGRLNGGRLNGGPYKIGLMQGLPLVTYLPGKLRADNCIAVSSTTATAMDPVIVMRVAGANLSSYANFNFCIFLQNSRSSSSMSFSPAKFICRHVATREFFKASDSFIFIFFPRRQNFLLSNFELKYY